MHGLVRQVLCEVQLLLLRSHRAQRQQSLRTNGVRRVRCRGGTHRIK